MICVAFHTPESGPDRPVQTLTWDGRAYALNPPDPERLNDILRRRVKDLDTKQLITAAQPEAFMARLQDVFRSAYLWADPPFVVAPVGQR